MPLMDLWKTSPDVLIKFNIEQVVATAGDGNLRDSSLCSHELREYLKRIPSEKPFEHVEACLSRAMGKGGAVLQDLINELGRRLGFQVENGLYQGRQNMIGFDGTWTAPDGQSLVVEIKTTDAYRINLDTIAGYRSSLISVSRLTKERSSILIVVGRSDTGDIEAQVRGSKHAWDMRLISTDALQIDALVLYLARGDDLGLGGMAQPPFHLDRLGLAQEFDQTGVGKGQKQGGGSRAPCP